jgi:hypothetical protein
MVRRINVPKTNLSAKGIRQLIKPLIELKLQLFLLPNEKNFPRIDSYISTIEDWSIKFI